MTSRERFLRVIRDEVPDRVPVTLFICDGGHFLNQIYPDIDPWDHERAQLKVIEIQKQFGADVFVRMLYGVNDPLFIHMGGLNVSVQTGHWEVTTEELPHGNTRIQRSTIRTPARNPDAGFLHHRSAPGHLRVRLHQEAHPARGRPGHRHPLRAAHARLLEGAGDPRVGRIRAALGDSGILGTWTPHGPFNNASLLVDHDVLYSLFRVDFPFYEKLMNFAMERILDYTAAIDEAGPDVHCVGGNVPGGFLGRANYERYVLPFERRYIEFVQRNGRPAMYHNCGQIMNLVESYKALGARMVEPFSPPPLGDADLKAVKAAVGRAYVILSGIDQVNVHAERHGGAGAARHPGDHGSGQARRRVHHAAGGFPGVRHAHRKRARLTLKRRWSTPATHEDRSRPKRRVGLLDLARALGLSIGTVDRALHNRPGVNPMTRAKVVQMARTLGYRPNLAARALASRRRTLFAAVLPRDPYGYFAEVGEGVMEAARAVEGAGVAVDFREYPWLKEGEAELIETGRGGRRRAA